MPPEPAARPRSEILEAGRGLGRLLGFDKRWAEGFDFSLGGFLRSFYGPLLALPFYVFYVAMVQATQVAERGVSLPILAVAAGEHLLDAFGFILIVFLIAKPLRVGAGFSAFATVVNWSSLYLNAILAVASLLLMAGADGLQVFGLVYLMLLIVSIFLVWRVGRETLTREFAPVLLVVVLSVAWSTVVDQLLGLVTGGL
ncbi:MAG: hypothetical protein WA840_15100 [Caulobacteraceae bacterium]